jgi:Zn-dependent protease
MLWPLGGLAALEIPHTPRANFIATAAGPAVNLILCVLTGLLLAASSLRPVLNPWSANADPLAPRMYKWNEGIYYGSSYQPGDPTKYTATPKDKPPEQVSRFQVDEKPATKDTQREFFLKDDPSVPVKAEGAAMLERWQVMAGRFFWINWVLLLLNLLPGFPLDGGRILQSILWARGEYRQATAYAVTTGFVVMFAIGVYAMWVESVWAILLAMFIYMSCNRQWYLLETGGEESVFGYDFSQGYTSLERDQQPTTTRPKKPNFIQRWLQRRAARRLQREQEEREAEERRLDELLEKVKDNGVQSLTDEERRFLTRVSSRYKNRNSS